MTRKYTWWTGVKSDGKAVVLSWTGTSDAVTSDVVSAWNVSGTAPTWATSWTAENTPANLNVTSSWTSYSLTAGGLVRADNQNLMNQIYATTSQITWILLPGASYMGAWAWAAEAEL